MGHTISILTWKGVPLFARVNQAVPDLGKFIKRPCHIYDTILSVPVRTWKGVPLLASESDCAGLGRTFLERPCHTYDTHTFSTNLERRASFRRCASGCAGLGHTFVQRPCHTYAAHTFNTNGQTYLFWKVRARLCRIRTQILYNTA
jgi:hypothetical protein